MNVTHWIETHPTLFAVVVWPTFSALFLGIFKPRTPEQYAQMNPRVAGFLMMLSGIGFDPHKALEGIKRAATGKAIPIDQAQAAALLKRSSLKPPPPIVVVDSDPDAVETKPEIKP